MDEDLSEKELVLKLLQSKPIAYRADFARICESVTAGIMLSQSYFWDGKSTKHGDGWFEKKAIEWEAETALSDKQQQTARHILEKKGFMESRRLGDRGRMCSHVNHDAVLSALKSLYLADRQKGDSEQIGKKEKLNRQNGDSKIGKKAVLSLHRLPTESTAESFTITPPPLKITRGKNKKADIPKELLNKVKPVYEVLKELIPDKDILSAYKTKTMATRISDAIDSEGIESVKDAVRGRAMIRGAYSMNLAWLFDGKDDYAVSLSAYRGKTGGKIINHPAIEPHMTELMAEFEEAQCQ